jgi:hypothetical protein
LLDEIANFQKQHLRDYPKLVSMDVKVFMVSGENLTEEEIDYQNNAVLYALKNIMKNSDDQAHKAFNDHFSKFVDIIVQYDKSSFSKVKWDDFVLDFEWQVLEDDIHAFVNKSNDTITSDHKEAIDYAMDKYPKKFDFEFIVEWIQ